MMVEDEHRPGCASRPWNEGEGAACNCGFAELFAVKVRRGEVQPMVALMDCGLLWLINRVVFHPRGLALALVEEGDGSVSGWEIWSDSDEPYSFSEKDDRKNFAKVEALLAELRST